MILAISVIISFAATRFSSAAKTQGYFVPMAEHQLYNVGHNLVMRSRPSSNNVDWWQDLSNLNKRNTPIATHRLGKNYEDDDTIDNEEPVDLHKGEFCVDVSTFGPIEYDSAPVKVCDTTFSKKCDDKYHMVIREIRNFCLCWIVIILYSCYCITRYQWIRTIIALTFPSQICKNYYAD